MGTIVAWAPNFAPRYWSLCQGQTLSISSNTALFSLLGTTYGGNGVSTFQLPNLSGRVPIGAGQGAGLPTVVLGEIGGSQSVTLNINQLPSHTHIGTITSVVIKASATEATDLLPSSTANVLAGPFDPVGLNAYAGFTAAVPDTALNTAFSGNVTNSPTGGNQPVSILPPYLGLNYIICTQGVFPSRN